MPMGFVAAVVAYIPALIANSLAVVFGGRCIIDGGRELAGRRILGDGKTWSGLVGGTLSAALVGIVLALLFNPYLHMYPFPLPGIYIIVTMAFGSLLGDLFGSFVKRRMGRERGAKTPVLDQYDFALGSFLLTYILFPGWTRTIYMANGGWIALISIILLIPLLHRGVNILGYRLGQKKEPW